MSNRLNDEIKMYSAIEKELINYPDYIIDWYYNLKANEHSATTCRDWINKIKQFLLFINPQINNVKLDDFSSDVVTKYFIKIQTKNEIVNGTEIYTKTSDSYRQCIWSCLNNFFEFLSDKQLINNPLVTAKIKRPSNKDLDRINKNRVLLTKEDFKNILNMVEYGTGSKKSRTYQAKYKNRDLSIMLLFMTTGIRRNALREINIDDIDFLNGKLVVVDKGDKEHIYSLNNQTLMVLKEWINDRYFMLGGNNKEKALFVSRDLKRISGSSIAELVDKYSSAALGYHISPHKLRSGLASIMYEETKDIEFVRRIIGHSNVKTTQRYIVTNNSERERATALMENILA